MRLESDSGVPCLILNDTEKLDDYEVYISGLRVNDGLNRFTTVVSEALLQTTELSENETARLILIPDYFRDSPDDRYNVAINEITGVEPQVETGFSWKERLTALNSKHGNVDVASRKILKGWYKNTLGETIASLSVYVNGVWLSDIRCDLPRADVSNIYGQQFLYSGFELTWPTDITIDTVEIKEAGTGQCVLNTPIIITSRRQDIARLERTLQSLRLNSDVSESSFSKSAVSRMFDALRASSPEGTVSGSEQCFSSVDREPGVSIIIPVYNSAKELKECLKSLLLSQDELPHEILLVNDASPDSTIHPYLAEVQIHYPRIHVIRSEYNRGFVVTVNKALAARRYRDVIILNSDTIVPNKIVDRLKAVKDDNPALGVITPLSNNATIFSFPRTLYNNPLGSSSTRGAIDALLESEARDIVKEVPTGHGYCMYVRGEVLDAVGPFNAEEWGVGYAEENDFCQKAKMAGWGIGAYYGMYVGHVGSTSFGEDTREELVSKNLTRLNELYPEYDSLIQDYINNDSTNRLLRNTLQLKYLKARASNNNEALMLYALHDLGGGTNEYVRRCSAELLRDKVLALRLITEGKDCLVICDDSGTIRCEYKTTSAEVVRLCQDLESLDLLEIVLNSTFNFTEKLLKNLLAMSVPYTVVVHDFSWICPKINMIDARGSFCGMPDTDVCKTCIEVSGVPDVLADDWLANSKNMTDWMDKNGAILERARLIICPSEDTARRIHSKYPYVEPTVRYHSDAFPVPVVVQSTNPVGVEDGLNRQKIAVFGRIGQHKGMAVLKNLIWLLSSRHPGVQIVFFGELCEYNWLKGYKNVEFVGEYDEDSLSGMIAQHKPTMALYLSVWPETYCYALTDAIRNGVFPIVFDIGAFKERIEMHNFGGTIPFSSDSETIYTAIKDLTKKHSKLLSQPSAIQSGVNYPSFLKDNMSIEGFKTQKSSNV